MQLKLFSKTIPASLLLVGNLFLFQPAFLYWGNKSFLTYSFGQIFLWLLPAFFLVLTLLFLFSLVIPARWQKYYAAILTGVTFAMWIATLFSGNLGQLDGKQFILVSDTKSLLINGFLLCSAAGLSAVMAYFNIRLTNYFLLTISALSAIFLLWVIAVSHKAPVNNWEKLENELVSFSKQKNVLLILLDTFQSDFFQALLNKNPDLAKQFSGFTYFPNAVSATGGTYLSVPTIHSGETYTPGQVVSSFYTDGVLKNSFVKAHVENGYQGMIINPFLGYCPEGVTCGDDNDIYFKQKAVGLSEGILLIKLSFFKSIPHFVQVFLYNHRQRVLQAISTPRAVISSNVLTELASSMNTNARTPTVKFLHLFNTHPPAVFDNTCKEIDSSIWNRDTAINQDKCAIAHIIAVLNAFKQKHIYDQTTIVILADHGAGFPPKNGFILGAAANPLLLYKPFNSAKANLKISNELVGLIDVSATLCAESKDCQHVPANGINILDNMSVNKERIFHFNLYEWKAESKYSLNEACKVNSFEIKGPPEKQSSWHKT